jgi:hypothetical protein
LKGPAWRKWQRSTGHQPRSAWTRCLAWKTNDTPSLRWGCTRGNAAHPSSIFQDEIHDNLHEKLFERVLSGNDRLELQICRYSTNDDARGRALAAMQSREILQSFCQRFECVRQILRILHVARCSQKLTMLGQGKGATCIPRFCGIISKLPGLSLSFDVSHTKGVLRLGGVYSTIAQYDQFVGRLWNGSPPKRYAKTGPARVEQTAVQMRNPGVAGV